MTADFSSIFNHHEREVFSAVSKMSSDFPEVSDDDLLVDVACVALNRLPPRYIRHAVDYAFYLTERERVESHAAIDEAVAYAFRFVKSRTELRARK